MHPTEPEPALLTAVQSLPGLINPPAPPTTPRPWLVLGTGSSVQSSTGDSVRQSAKPFPETSRLPRATDHPAKAPGVSFAT